MENQNKLTRVEIRTVLQALKNEKAKELSQNKFDIYNSKELGNEEMVKYFETEEGRIHDRYREISIKLFEKLTD